MSIEDYKEEVERLRLEKGMGPCIPSQGLTIDAVENDIHLNLHDADSEQLVAIANILFPAQVFILDDDETVLSFEEA